MAEARKIAEEVAHVGNAEAGGGEVQEGDLREGWPPVRGKQELGIFAPGMRRRRACVRPRSGEEARAQKLLRWAKATGWMGADNQSEPSGASWTIEMAGSSAEGQVARTWKALYVT